MRRSESRLRWGAVALTLILALRPVAQAAGMPVRASALARAHAAGQWCGPAAVPPVLSSSVAAFGSVLESAVAPERESERESARGSSPVPALPPAHKLPCDDAPCCLPVVAMRAIAYQQPTARPAASPRLPPTRNAWHRRDSAQLRWPPANGPPLS